MPASPRWSAGCPGARCVSPCRAGRVRTGVEGRDRLDRRHRRSLAPHLTRLDEIRRAHPALLRNLRFYTTGDNEFSVFSEAPRLPDRHDVIVVADLDPHTARNTWIHLDMPALGVSGTNAPSLTIPSLANTGTGPVRLRAPRTRYRAGAVIHVDCER